MSETPGPNAEMKTYWNEEAGPRWVLLQERLDASIRGIGDRTLAAAAPAEGESVLDVGCGCGATLLALAEAVGPSGRVLGLDVSEPMLARAAARAAGPGGGGHPGLGLIELQRGDAQTLDLASAGFDLVFSRFGVMFFDDPERAFANLCGAVRPGGRLAFCCWRERELNPWMWTAMQAAARHLELPEPPEDPHAPGPFALWDAERLRGLLEAAGWSAVRLEDFDERFLLGGGGSLAEAVDFALEMGPLPGLMAEASEETRARVRASVAEALAPHLQEAGVSLPGAARIVTAKRPED